MSRFNSFTEQNNTARSFIISTALAFCSGNIHADVQLPSEPLYSSTINEAPLVLLTMGRNHKLFYEAYNDITDIDGDEHIDAGYQPNTLDYDGYFDSYKCYHYDTSSTAVFKPVYTTSDKTCSNSSAEWSGDFLNYITTSKMDILRKSLYGGYRSVDTNSSTYLERTHIPQDGHSWGKEYKGLDDGYDIQDYSPLDLPATGLRHLFASTSLNISGDDDIYEPPLMRVLSHTSYRVWDWLSTERPVADSTCGLPKLNCVSSEGTSKFSIIPASATVGTSNVNLQLFDIRNFDASPICDYGTSQARCVGARSQTEMDKVEQFAINAAAVFPELPNIPFAVDTANNVDFPNTDIYSQIDDYLLYITGSINISTAGDYEFAVDGDDAVDLHIDLNNNFSFTDANEDVAHYYGLHAFDDSLESPPSNASTPFKTTTVTLTPGSYHFRIRLAERGGGAGVKLYWAPPGSSTPTTLVDYEVRTEVCVPGLLEANCVQYPNGNYKPTGVLHTQANNGAMQFGLLTGSYTNNLSGGVLRKTISSFDDEFNSFDGVYNNSVGIVKTIDRLREIGFNLNEIHNSNCGFIFDEPLSEKANLGNGTCRWWGNPVAEMMYEGLRYFAGMNAPTAEFSYNPAGSDDEDLGLPLATWDNPYNNALTNAKSCAVPIQMVISDINPSYDSDELPGVNSHFQRRTLTDTLSGLDVSSLAANITLSEDTNNSPADDDIAGMHYIGQSLANKDFAPTAKNVNHLGDIRGLAVEEPGKEGSYYSASVAAFGIQNDMQAAIDGDQKVHTVALALASNLPEFDISIRGNQIVTIRPFAKSVGGASVLPGDSTFKPTNTIIGTYLERVANTRPENFDASINSGMPYYKIRVTFEDGEQGNDHDMDATAIYEIQVNDNGTPVDTADDLLSIGMQSHYAAGSVQQHMGYFITGTSADGIYLDVRDADTSSSADVDYLLDTPNTTDALPLSTTATPRIFTPDNASTASLLKDPLWYAAKWGSFIDANDNNEPDLIDEWDRNADGIPDNYFRIKNGNDYKQGFESAMDNIQSFSKARSVKTALKRDPDLLYRVSTDTYQWDSTFQAFLLNGDGVPEATAFWDASSNIPDHTQRMLFTQVDRGAGVINSIEFSAADPDLVSTLGDADTIYYIRGDQSQEQQNGGNYRDRDSLFGDVAQAQPVIQTSIDLAYSALPGQEGLSYSSFLTDSNAVLDSHQFSVLVDGNNKNVNGAAIYQGTNDGLLRALDRATGNELFAYIPRAIQNKLPLLTENNYSHTAFVDASPVVSHAYINSGNGASWNQLLIGTLGHGGRSIFALKVNDPWTFSASDVLWEKDSNEIPQLGHIFDAPEIARLHHGGFAIVTGNGLNSDNDEASLLILDAASGNLIREINTGLSANGLFQPRLVDEDGDRIMDFAIAGDFRGRLWKFNLQDPNPANWRIAYDTNGDGSGTPLPLYIAQSALGHEQAITTKPQVRIHPDGGYQVVFGTGSFLTQDDVNDPGFRQTLYGIRDNLIAPVPAGRANLIQQQAIEEFEVQDSQSLNTIATARRVTDNTVNTAVENGWFLDLNTILDSADERIVSDLTAYRDGIYTKAYVHQQSCASTTQYLFTPVDFFNGARLIRHDPVSPTSIILESEHDWVSNGDESYAPSIVLNELVQNNTNDLDGDSVSDIEEIVDGTNPVNANSDSDLLDDGEEKALGTDPLLADTDGDSLLDHEDPEPLIAQSTAVPLSNGIIIILALAIIMSTRRFYRPAQ